MLVGVIALAIMEQLALSSALSEVKSLHVGLHLDPEGDSWVPPVPTVRIYGAVNRLVIRLIGCTYHSSTEGDAFETGWDVRRSRCRLRRPVCLRDVRGCHYLPVGSCLGVYLRYFRTCSRRIERLDCNYYRAWSMRTLTLSDVRFELWWTLIITCWSVKSKRSIIKPERFDGRDA